MNGVGCGEQFQQLRLQCEVFWFRVASFPEWMPDRVKAGTAECRLSFVSFLRAVSVLVSAL
ncbi:hypothetical protein [Streptomyces sp. MI02-7b]|uniref:hypothetical protein n=1 Tax=Streptomyces sp. MI02-7b TaxID=462941 RepID=UPI0029A48ADA|nr:hypothetical protein [Streptomyces sp. MI02-7b]MDX3078512.1 hypothetical protein [Streptomyces sp. MI02-7b]